MSADAIVDLYERHAHDFDRDRSRSLQERAWLDRFLALVPRSGTVLDIGCGTSEPIGRYLLDAGVQVVGIDSSPSMIALCKARRPDAEWIAADMRHLELGRRFNGLLAWDSFFHLHMDDQRQMFPRFAKHAEPGAPLMFTSGPSHGEAIGSCFGEPLYHGSLAPSEYEALLVANGFTVVSYVPDDPECGGHTVWLARFVADRTRRAASS
jgi:SAM-dependent methyltransferase